jgi:hypothetical protein
VRGWWSRTVTLGGASAATVSGELRARERDRRPGPLSPEQTRVERVSDSRGCWPVGLSRPSKVTANALRAGFVRGEALLFYGGFAPARQGMPSETADFKGKLTQGPAVRVADRRHSL